MLLINIPDEPYYTQRVTLESTAIRLITKFNSRNNSWYLDIKTGGGSSDILSGIKIMPNQNLTGRYDLPLLPDGNFFCLRTQNRFDDIGRDNFGNDKVYQLYWVPTDEELEAGLDGITQL